MSDSYGDVTGYGICVFPTDRDSLHSKRWRERHLPGGSAHCSRPLQDDKRNLLSAANPRYLWFCIAAQHLGSTVLKSPVIQLHNIIHTSPSPVLDLVRVSHGEASRELTRDSLSAREQTSSTCLNRAMLYSVGLLMRLVLRLVAPSWSIEPDG